MSEYMVERLESITDNELKYLADFTGELFAQDPGFELYLSGDPSLTYIYWTAYIRATILEGELWVVKVRTDGEYRIVSWVSWFAPGNSLWSTEAQRKLGFSEFYERCSPELQHWMWNTRVLYAKKLFSEVFSPEEMKALWKCSCIATHPQYQRKGYATTLMEIGFQKAKKANETVILASTDPVNVHIITSMGMKAEGGGEVPSPRGSFCVTIMVKRT